jgi:hypothetical protein
MELPSSILSNEKVVSSYKRRVELMQGHLQGASSLDSTAEPRLDVHQTSSETSFCTIKRTLFHPSKTECKAEYDYIVVGAGSSGCALAARLAEKSPNKTILLVDAGGDNQQFRVKSPFITCPKL